MHQVLNYIASFPFVISLLFFVLLLWMFKLGIWPGVTKYKLPPSPPKLPFIGNLHQLHDSPHHDLLSLSRKYGPLMLLHLGRMPTLVVSSANMAHEVLKTHDHVFSSRPQLLIPKRLYYGKDMVFAPYGEYWRQVRKVCVLELLSAKKVQSFHSVREEEIALMMDKIEEISFANLEVNMSQMFVSLTFNIVCRSALGRKYSEGEEGIKFQRSVREFMYLLGVFDVGDMIPSLAWVNHFNGLNTRVEKNFRDLDSFFDQVVKEHEEKKRKDGDAFNKEEDFVDVLLRIEKDIDLGIPFGRDSTKALILDMFTDGTDTTAVVLDWAMSELIRHPTIMDEVKKEVRDIARGKTIIKENDIEEMHYLRAVIKETLRLHPPAPLLVMHESMDHVNIQGYDIPAKTRVIINAVAIGREELWWEEPEKFWPKRFLNGRSASVDFKGRDFQLIPFGAGRRGCPGMHFAICTIEAALANLLNRFDWTLPNGMDGKNLDMDEVYGIVVNRKNDLVLTLQVKPVT